MREYDFPVDWPLERAFRKAVRAWLIAHPEFDQDEEVARELLDLTKVDGPDLTDPPRYLIRVQPR